MIAANSQEQNAEIYEALISLIENSQGRLAPIIVACDDWALRQRIIEQYETEAQQAQIRPYRVRLGQEPSVRAALARLKSEHDYLQQGGKAVFTITGAEVLLRIPLKPEDEQSELDKFFGYLQWTREGLREFRYPIVLWVTYRILKEMSRRAPDFWSWRKAVLRFVAETEPALSTIAQLSPPSTSAFQSNDSLPPLDELQAEIQQLEAAEPTSPNLATLYDQLGQLYAKRVRNGETANLPQEQAAAIAAFQTAIHWYQQLDRKSAQAAALTHLGNFLCNQSRFTDAIDFYQQSLEIARGIGNRQGEAASLNNLGNVYRSLGRYPQAIEFYQQSLAIKHEIVDRKGKAASLNNLAHVYESLGQYPQAIEFYQQSLAIKREVGDLNGEAASLNGLGNAYLSLGQYPQAIEFYQQSLAIQREISDHKGEATSLGNLGNVYESLGQYPQAIEFYQQSLAIAREIGDRNGEANSLYNLGFVLARLDQHDEALQSYQQALTIYEALKLDHRVERCKTAIADASSASRPA